ncbi:N utilization substance protein B [Corynebacterium sp. CNJ-954]|uniref:transcription antitermination factor NusB n=1 Tax=Corynebacterium sp. CNJ-954 TaxID=1904962 RepID=UPI00096241A4|nr:transcription antitermination factor NusB [Corynebacterium sp. CNJ-954]OLT50606.1 N utilization substance protein B [Corynebacterium sp. CNJ-954]
MADTESGESYRRHGARYKARQRAVDILFEAEFRDIDPVEIVEDRVELARDDSNQVKPVPEYAARIVPGVASALDEIDEAIAAHLSSTWRLDRLPAVDRAVLRVSAWELLYNEEVPARVALKEGIELASEYSHDKAPGYVNAVLDGIARDKRLADEAAAAAEAEQDAAEAKRVQDAERAQADSLIDGIVDETSDTPDPSGETGEK